MFNSTHDRNKENLPATFDEQVILTIAVFLPYVFASSQTTT